MESFKVYSPILELDDAVDHIFPQMSGMWNEGLIRSIFSSDEANAILNSILGSRINEDKLIWHFSPYDVYSSKSGCRVVKEFLKLQNDPPVSLLAQFCPLP